MINLVIEYKGEEYKSLRRLADARGLDYNAVINALYYKKLSIDDAIDYLEQGLRGIRGEVYKTLTDMCKAYNLKVGNYKLLRGLGLSKETILKAGGLKYKGECLGYFTKYYKYGYTDEDIKKAVRMGYDLYEVRQLPKVIKTDHNGVEYPTMTAMAEAYGKNVTSVASRLKSGWTVEDALTKDIAKKSTEEVKDHLGNKYPTMTAMCKAYGVSLPTYRYRRSLGLSVECALDSKILNIAKPKVDHLGNKFISMADMAQAYCIDVKTLISRLYLGWSLEKALTKPSRGYTKGFQDHLGNEYKTLIEMCKHYKIKVNVYFSRLNNGWSLERVLTTPMRDRSCTDHKGNKYGSLQELTRAYNINYNLFYSRYSQGWSMEEALTTPSDRINKVIVDHKGKEYRTVKELCCAYGIPQDAYYRRLAKGMSLEETLTKGVRGRTRGLGKVSKNVAKLF